MPFDTFPIESTPVPNGYNGWLLFLDEMNSASKAVQVAAYKLVLDRMVGNYNLHPDCYIVAAGNLATDKAIVNQMSTAMQSRLVHIEMAVNNTDWLENVAYPEQYDKRIIGFLGMYPNKLCDFNPDHNEKTFCSPRTWSFVQKLISRHYITDDDIPLLAGTITTGVAIEFVQFCKVYDNLLTLDDILQDPTGIAVPTETSIKWATVSSLIEVVTPDNFTQLTKFINRFDLSFRIIFYRSLFIRRKELKALPEFIEEIAEISKYINS